MKTIPILILCCAALLTACTQSRAPAEPMPSADDSSATRAGPSDREARVAAPTEVSQPTLIRGSGEFTGVATRRDEIEIPPGDDVLINFTNTDIRAVMDTILGATLGLNYSIDPKVQGPVTIQAARPVPRQRLLMVMDALLRQQGAALVPMDGFVRVIPLADAGAQSTSLTFGDDRQLGYATVVVPVIHVSVEELRRVLEPVTRQGMILQTDPVRNLFLVGGTRREIQSFTEAVQIFDVDWLKGMSFGLFPLRAAEPEKLEQELRRILHLDTGPMRGLVELVPIPRLDSLLVAARRPDLLDQVAEWIPRLDQQGTSGGRMLHFYEVQNGTAAELAGALSRLTGTASPSAQAGAGMRNTSLQGSVQSPASAAGGSVAPVGAVSADSLPPEFRNVRFVADEPRNALIVFASEQQFQTLLPTLERLDSPRDQVLIEATIAEVHLTGDLNFGVQWYLQRGHGFGGLVSGNSVSPSPSLPGAFFSYVTPSTQVVLSALSSVTNVSVLSAPRLVVLNNQPARLEVGDQVPIITQTAVGVLTSSAPVVNSVEMRDTGVILEVTPHVNRSGIVVLDIVQEVSSVVPTTSSSINSPTIQQRRINSTVAIKDGETVALGGLISTTQTKSNSGLPWLSSIPVVGPLFGTLNDSSDREELILFLRPVVIHSVDQARAMTSAMKTSMGRLKETLQEEQKQGRSTVTDVDR